MNMKLFVLTLRDLSLPQQAVQAGHALAEFLLHGPETDWDNGTLVYLSVKDEDELQRWVYRLQMKYVDFVTFQEPDLNNKTTALACVCEDKILSKLNLIE